MANEDRYAILFAGSRYHRPSCATVTDALPGETLLLSVAQLRQWVRHDPQRRGACKQCRPLDIW